MSDHPLIPAPATLILSVYTSEGEDMSHAFVPITREAIENFLRRIEDTRQMARKHAGFMSTTYHEGMADFRTAPDWDELIDTTMDEGRKGYEEDLLFDVSDTAAEWGVVAGEMDHGDRVHVEHAEVELFEDSICFHAHVGTFDVGYRAETHPIQVSAIMALDFLTADSEQATAAFRRLAAEDPVLALEICEGKSLHLPRDIVPSISEDMLRPLLQQEDSGLRRRALLLLDRVPPAESASEPETRRPTP